MKRKLRKMFLGLLAVVLTTSYVSAQLTFGPRAGFNFTNMLNEFDGQKPPKEFRDKSKSGFQIGAVADYEFSTAMSIQSGLLFAQQGYKVGSGYSGPKTIVNLNYLQIPINVQLKFPLGGIDLLVQTGPYLGFGINGKYKYWNENGKRMSNEDIEKWFGEIPKVSFGNEFGKDHLKSFDLGIGFGAGLQFGNIQAGLGYNMGVRNLSIQSPIKHSIDALLKNNGLALTITYLFGN